MKCLPVHGLETAVGVQFLALVEVNFACFISQYVNIQSNLFTGSTVMCGYNIYNMYTGI